VRYANVPCREKKYPSCKVIVFGNAVNKELLSGNNDVDQYEIFEKGSLFSNMKKAKMYNADFACAVTPSFANLAALYLAGIPCISAPAVEGGWSPYETKTYKILRRLVRTVPHSMGSYAPREYLRLLEPMHIKTDNTEKHLSFSSEAREKVSLFLSENKVMVGRDFVVCISPSAGNKIKKWSEQNFANLTARIITEYNAKVIFIGGKNDSAEVEFTKKLLGNVPVVDTCGLFTMDELKALIAQMSVFISVDTGPVYIAEAFGVPTIDIVGPMDEREQPPRGKKHKVVVGKRMAPELHIMNARVYNETEARRQIDIITIDEVMDTFYELFPESIVPRVRCCCLI
jgi:ADP-heptose:LPS heptosyltransferase